MISLTVTSRLTAYSFSALCSAAVSRNCNLRVRLSRAGLIGRPPFEALAILNLFLS
jgi:hypothetical protein